MALVNYKETWIIVKKMIYPLLLTLSFFIWFSLFHSFILGKLGVVSDAPAYFQHFKFYLDSIGHGIYPMWEPSRQGGVPFEIFARRIGSFNPLFLSILFFSQSWVAFSLRLLFIFDVLFFSWNDRFL